MDTKRNLSKFMRIGVPIIAVMLLIATIVLSVFVGMYASDRSNLRYDIENIYSRAYYDLLESNLRLENNLSKLRVISSPRLIESTLIDISKDAQAASSAIATMAAGDEMLRSIIGFYNQLGDYHSYLAKLVTKSGTLSSNDYDTIFSFAERTREVGRSLNSMREQMDENFTFREMLAEQGGTWFTMIDELSQTQNKYPALIYDGPFSDGVDDREPKGIVGEELNEEQLKKLIPQYFPDDKILSIDVTSHSANRIPSIIFDVQLGNESHATVELATKGGMMLMMEHEYYTDDPKLSAKECELLAEQYCTKIGLKDMKAVWIQINNSVAYINLCSTVGGTIIYPDMVKIKVAMDNGRVIGYEGLNYAFNHTERKLPTPTLTQEDAILSVNSGLSDLSCRLAVIPQSTLSETLCYEISGTLDGERYFIFIDVITHDEINILRVIDSNQGELLM